MEEQVDKKTQGAALGLVLVAALVLVGGYMYKHGNILQILNREPQVEQSGHCPIDVVGTMLNMELERRSVTAADGSSAAVISVINEDGLAEKSGLHAGDIIVTCQGERTRCPRDVLMQMQQGWNTGAVTLQIERDGEPVEVTIATSEETGTASEETE